MDAASKQSKGGEARAKSLSKNRRSEIAKKAAVARWAAHLPDATHEGELNIAGFTLPVAVTSDGTRLMISKAFMTALGRPWKGSYAGTELPNFIAAKNLLPFISNELRSVLDPIEFINKHGQRTTGYRAELLRMVCDVYLEARRAGVLTESQQRVAAQSEVLIRAFADLGIVALVDEATGYQKDRASDALAKILEKFIAKELQPWVKTFPDEFYEQLFRLRGLAFPKDTVKKPQYFGYLTNDIVYKRLAPGILEELKKTDPKTSSGRRKGTLQQRLTQEIGHPKLREHLASVCTIMDLSEDYNDFMKKLDRRHPRFGETIELNFHNDKGQGL
ncbi:P63C domain-containing protein [Komagataeibacter diospyri]|uniref:P63C domain-containing protein n=1 Tax=Komagataeibacter diospyri TaxID=1932662 RepID=UPI0037567842